MKISNRATWQIYWFMNRVNDLIAAPSSSFKETDKYSEIDIYFHFFQRAYIIMEKD